MTMRAMGKWWWVLVVLAGLLVVGLVWAVGRETVRLSSPEPSFAPPGMVTRAVEGLGLERVSQFLSGKSSRGGSHACPERSRRAAGSRAWEPGPLVSRQKLVRA